MNKITTNQVKHGEQEKFLFSMFYTGWHITYTHNGNKIISNFAVTSGK